MKPLVIGVIVIVFILVLLPIPGMLRGEGGPNAPVIPTVQFTNSPIHIAARDGKLSSIEDALSSGANVNAQDEYGRTPLHYAAENGHGQTTARLLSMGADPMLVDGQGDVPRVLALRNNHNQTAGYLPDTPGATVEASTGTRLNPSLKYRDLHSFEQAIGQPATLLKSDHIWFFAPITFEKEAAIVHPYLVNAYDAFYEIVGVHTQYVIVVYNFPPGHEDAFGGTSNCTIWYDDSNLRLDQHEEWRKHHVPHVSGYIEEMAHNFNFTQFGWEMVGWSIGIKASQKVASNPVFQRSLDSTMRGQRETFERYRALDYTFPNDIPNNQVDRIHAYILFQCEAQYGPNFWRDFFREAKKEKTRMTTAERDERYRMTIDCFDRLPGLNFKELLRENHISLTTDIKSMNPEGAGWNRKLE